MKKLLLLFLSAFLFTSICDARLGETVSQVIMTHPHFRIVSKSVVDERSYILVFHDKENLVEVGVIFLNDVCAEEIFSSYTNTDIEWETYVNYMKTYCPHWVQIGHSDPRMSAAMSDNGLYFALWGPAPYLERRMALRIFTHEWRDYTRDHKVSLSKVNI